MTTSIREATDGDAPALASLLAELGYPTSAAEMPARLGAAATAPGKVLVAEHEAEVVGVVAVVRDVGVDESQRPHRGAQVLH